MRVIKAPLKVSKNYYLAVLKALKHYFSFFLIFLFFFLFFCFFIFLITFFFHRIALSCFKNSREAERRFSSSPPLFDLELHICNKKFGPLVPKQLKEWQIEMLSGDLPAAPPGDQAPPATPLAPACLRRPRAGKAPGSGSSGPSQFPALQSPHLVSSYFVWKLPCFVLFCFLLIFLHLLLPFVIYIFFPQTRALWTP